MQTSALRKLMQLIKSLLSLPAESRWEETSEQEAASDMEPESKDITAREAEKETPEETEDKTVAEAVAAPAGESVEEPAKAQNRAHLTSSVPRAAKIPEGAISKSELTELRQLFGSLTDAEIQRLYKRVKK